MKLLPCPFCGDDEPEFERMGTGRQSCIVVCTNCGCRHDSGDSGEHSGTSWNRRTMFAAEAAEVEEHQAWVNELSTITKKGEDLSDVLNRALRAVQAMDDLQTEWSAGFGDYQNMITEALDTYSPAEEE